MNRLASRKLVAALASIALIAVNARYKIGLTDEEIRSITDITLAALGLQGGVDVIQALIPAIQAVKAKECKDA